MVQKVTVASRRPFLDVSGSRPPPLSLPGWFEHQSWNGGGGYYLDAAKEVNCLTNPTPVLSPSALTPSYPIQEIVASLLSHVGVGPWKEGVSDTLALRGGLLKWRKEKPCQGYCAFRSYGLSRSQGMYLERGRGDLILGTPWPWAYVHKISTHARRRRISTSYART